MTESSRKSMLMGTLAVSSAAAMALSVTASSAMAEDYQNPGLWPPVSQTGDVSGTVVNEAGAPIEGVLVCTHDFDPRAYMCRTTGADGSYHELWSSVVDDDVVQVSFQDPSGVYQAEYYDNADSLETATGVPRNTSETVNAVLARTVSPEIESPIQWPPEVEAEPLPQSPAAPDATVGPAPQASAPNPSRPAASVRVKAKAKRGKVVFNVNPNQATRNYVVKVQRKKHGKWETIKVSTTRGKKDKLTIALGIGKYRVKVPAQFGLSKAVRSFRLTA